MTTNVVTAVADTVPGLVRPAPKAVDPHKMVLTPSSLAVKDINQDPTKEVNQSNSFPVTSKVVTPIKVDILASYLGNYSQCAYLVEGFTFGFRLGYSGQRQFRVSPNMSSCQQYQDVISQKIKAEVALGRLKGPFQNPPFKNM